MILVVLRKECFAFVRGQFFHKSLHGTVKFKGRGHRNLFVFNCVGSHPDKPSHTECDEFAKGTSNSVGEEGHELEEEASDKREEHSGLLTVKTVGFRGAKFCVLEVSLGFNEEVNEGQSRVEDQQPLQNSKKNNFNAKST